MSKTNQHTPDGALRNLSREALIADPEQPRKYFASDKLDELARSIKAEGILQPLLVRPASLETEGGGYIIVTGERRWRAAEIAGLDTVPCVVRELDDRQALLAQVVENEQREDITPLEESDAFAHLHNQHGLSVEDIAEQTGMSRTTVYGRLKLQALIPAAREHLAKGDLSAEVAQMFARLPESVQLSESGLRVLGQCIFGLINGPWALDEQGYTTDVELAADYVVNALSVRDAEPLIQALMQDEEFLNLQTELIEFLLKQGVKKETKLSAAEVQKAIKAGDRIDLFKIDKLIDSEKPLNEVLSGHLAGAVICAGKDVTLLTMTPKQFVKALQSANIESKSAALAKADKAKSKKSKAKNSPTEVVDGDANDDPASLIDEKAMAAKIALQREVDVMFEARVFTQLREAIKQQGLKAGVFNYIAVYFYLFEGDSTTWMTDRQLNDWNLPPFADRQLICNQILRLDGEELGSMLAVSIVMNELAYMQEMLNGGIDMDDLADQSIISAWSLIKTYGIDLQEILADCTAHVSILSSH